MLSFNDYKDIVNNNLLKYLNDIDEHAIVLKESMSYSLSVGGKRIRPVLLLAAADFAGLDIDTAIPYACAIEYIHTYSLIHDDLPAMDNDQLRRGKPTNHMVYGEDIAILAGDGLLNTASEIMLSEALKADPDTIIHHVAAAKEIMTRAGVLGMIAGQTADVVNENNEGTSELVRFIEEHKCGDLITAAVLAGLKLAGSDQSVINDFESYAMNMGTAFQVLDDILDFEGDAANMGKTLGKDADQNKCNYVCVHGINAARAELKRLTEASVNALDKYGDKAEFFRELAIDLKERNH